MSTNSNSTSSTSTKSGGAGPDGQATTIDRTGVWMGVGMFLVIGVPMIVIMALKWMS